MTIKHDKFESIAREVISSLIHDEMEMEETDFGPITATKAQVTKDKSYLDIYVSSFQNLDLLPKALAKHWFNIQKNANKLIKMRRVPKIRFRTDKSWEDMAYISWVINKLKK